MKKERRIEVGALTMDLAQRLYESLSSKNFIEFVVGALRQLEEDLSGDMPGGEGEPNVDEKTFVHYTAILLDMVYQIAAEGDAEQGDSREAAAVEILETNRLKVPKWLRERADELAEDPYAD